MTVFIISALVLIVVALFMIVPTLLKKNQPITDDYDALNVSIAKDRLKEIKQQLDAGDITQEVYQQLHDELEATLALDLANSQTSAEAGVEENKIPVPLITAIMLPVLAVILYSQIGDFNAATGKAVQSVEIPAGENRQQMSIEEAIAKLQLRLQQEPDNADGWYMLAKTYMTTQQYPQAASAYKQTIDLVGDDPQLLLRYADALAMTEGGSLTGAAKPVLDKVMKLVPDSPTVLWMAGTAESQQSNFTAALRLWYKLRPMLGEEPEALKQLEQLISEAEGRLTAEQLASLKQDMPEQTATAMPVAASSAEINVNVSIDPAFQDQVSPGDTLFIFAKAVNGPPMPLAAVKQTVASLPLSVTLNDAMAMMPQMKISSFEQVTISAVISKSGQPGARSGDLFVEVSPVSVGTAETVELLINQVKP